MEKAGEAGLPRKERRKLQRKEKKVKRVAYQSRSKEVLENFYKKIEAKTAKKKQGKPKPSRKRRNEAEKDAEEGVSGKRACAEPKSLKEMEKEVHQEEISRLDKELVMLEKKMGIHDDPKKKEKVKRRFAHENWDPDMIDFLENIGRSSAAAPRAEVHHSGDSEEEDAGVVEVEEDVGDSAQRESGAEEEESKEPAPAQAPAEASDQSEEVVEEERKGREPGPTVEACEKKLKGLFNKLSEGNIEGIFEDTVRILRMGEEYAEKIVELFATSAVKPVQLLSHLQPAYCALIIALSKIAGESLLVSALKSTYRHATQELTEDSAPSKKNALYALLRFFQLGALKAGVVLDAMTELAEQPSAFSLDILSVFIKQVGFDLRKQDPVRLKQFIEKMEQLSERVSEECKKRLEFLMEDLNNVRNNKKQAIHESAREKIQPLVTWLQSNSRIRSEVGSGPLLLDWKSLGDNTPHLQEIKPFVRDKLKKLSAKASGLEEEISVLEDIATEQRMNTQIKKIIFTTMMTAEDYMDAFERVLQLSLTKAQEREIIKVLVSCCGQEKYYNRYYSLLAQKLCESKIDFVYTLKFTYWDHIKNLHRYTLRKVNNLARLLADLVCTTTVPLSILKILEFEQLSQYQIIFLNLLLEEVFGRTDNEIRIIFGGIPEGEKLAAFKEGMLFYLLNAFRKKMLKKLKGSDQLGEFKRKLSLIH